MKTIVIIPAYNESENIVNTVTALTTSCPDVDYIIINDCSTDNTAAICEEHGFHYINLPINLGIGGGMRERIVVIALFLGRTERKPAKLRIVGAHTLQNGIVIGKEQYIS